MRCSASYVEVCDRSTPPEDIGGKVGNVTLTRLPTPAANSPEGVVRERAAPLAPAGPRCDGRALGHGPLPSAARGASRAGAAGGRLGANKSAGGGERGGAGRAVETGVLSAVHGGRLACRHTGGGGGNKKQGDDVMSSRVVWAGLG